MLNHSSRKSALPNKRKVELQRFNVRQLRDQRNPKGMEIAIMKSINPLFGVRKLCFSYNANGFFGNVLEIRRFSTPVYVLSRIDPAGFIGIGPFTSDWKET